MDGAHGIGKAGPFLGGKNSLGNPFGQIRQPRQRIGECAPQNFRGQPGCQRIDRLKQWHAVTVFGGDDMVRVRHLHTPLK